MLYGKKFLSWRDARAYFYTRANLKLTDVNDKKLKLCEGGSVWYVL